MRVSVVVPTYQRPDLLERCLTALARQDLEPDAYEIIVADDAALPATRVQVENFMSPAKPVVRYIAVAGVHGPAAARNAAWRQARAPIVAFTDDDCQPEPGWLRAGMELLESDASMSAVTGRTIVPLPAELTDHARNTAGLENAEFLTANCFCRRDVLEQVGGFDERFTTAWREDSDLQFSILEMGGRIAHCPGAVVVHPVRPAPWGYCLREQRKSSFEALLYKKHRELYRSRILPKTPWHYYGIVASLALGAATAMMGQTFLAGVAVGVWSVLTGRFIWRRLRGTSRAPAHLFEMVCTSLAIPPLSVFWRLYGAWRYRVAFV